MIADIASSFAYGTKIQKDIDRLYEKNKYFYYEKAATSPAYSDYCVSMGDIRLELYTKRALGILLCAEEDKKLADQVAVIIKKHYFEIYSAVVEPSPKSFKRFSDSYNDALPAKVKTYENLYFYLAVKNCTSKQDLPKAVSDPIEGYIQSHEFIARNALPLKNHDDVINKYRKLIDSIKNRLSENIGEYRGYEEVWHSSHEHVRKYAGIVAAMFDFDRVSSSRIMSEITLTDRQIDEIICSYLQCYRDQNLERTTNILLSGIVIKTLILRLKEARIVFFENNKETLFVELHSKEKSIKELSQKLVSVSRERDKYRAEVIGFRNSLKQKVNLAGKQYRDEIRMLETKVKRLEKELDSERAYRSELNGLRSLFFDIQTDGGLSNSQKDLAEITRDFKIAVIGGTPEWRKKMTLACPNILALDGFNENLELKPLKNVKMAFFYTGFMNHKTYYRVIDFLRNLRRPVGYIGRTNLDLVETEIVEQIRRYRS